ncbi:MAG: putative gliding motility regulatory protein [Frankiales bacterium]|nr:putative gliding motility regulatory protein [Frankiales bacterium]
MVGLNVAQVRTLFSQEATVRLAQLGQLLLQLEQIGSDETLIRSIFREIHTLKGSAAVAGLAEVSECAHELEELVEDLRTGRRSAAPDVIDTLLAGADRLAALIASHWREGETSATGDPLQRTAQSSRVNVEHPAMTRNRARVGHELLSGDPTHLGDAEPAKRPGPAARMLPAAAVALAPSDPATAAGGVIMVPTARLEELTRMVGESASAHLRIGKMLKDRFGVDPGSCPEFNELSRSLNDLQDRATRTQMVPVATVTDQLQRGVRDLSRAQGKEVRWETRGVDTEMDRGVLHQLADSLLHLVRNAVDHGIEPVAERLAAGKPAHATIRLHAMQLGSEVIIAISDDGRGIDTVGISRRAARHGIDSEGFSEEDLLGLIFSPGLSTTDFVTDVSGRGIGLDVVRTNVEAARGRVEVRSEHGAGTEFRIIVPITLAVLRCLLVEAGGQRFALPFHRVVLSKADDPAMRAHAEGRPVLLVDNQPVPVTTLTQTLGTGSAEPVVGPIVVLADTSRRHAFQVDRLVGQRDVVLKTLSRLLPHLPAVAGASVEPDGSVLLVLDPPGLIHRARQAGRGAAVAPAQRPDGPRGRILVVDDALTVRELQRSILERAGFLVRVASDGSQAMSKLAEEPSDLVLTDIEMPTMDGFALTAAIRAHPSLANIPVLILSSRSSEADRRRGLDVGADGYIIKSGFDEASLLTAVNRLLGASA